MPGRPKTGKRHGERKRAAAAARKKSGRKEGPPLVERLPDPDWAELRELADALGWPWKPAPPRRSPQLEELILAAITRYSVHRVLGPDRPRDLFPAYDSFLQWVHQDEDRAAEGDKSADLPYRYARAMEARLEMMAGETLAIADGELPHRFRHGSKLRRAAPDVERDRLRVQARQWLMAKTGGKYRDRTALEHSVEGATLADLVRLVDRDRGEEQEEGERG